MISRNYFLYVCDMYFGGFSTFCWFNFYLITFLFNYMEIPFKSWLKCFSCVVFNEDQVSFF